MSIALLSGIIIFVVLAILLIAGIPISVAIGVSSLLAILPTLNFESVVLTAHKGPFQEYLYLH